MPLCVKGCTKVRAYSAAIWVRQATYDPTAATARHKWRGGQWLLSTPGAKFKIRQDIRKWPQFCCLVGSRPATTLDGWQNPPRCGQQDGSVRHPQIADRRGHEPDQMGCAQGRQHQSVAGQSCRPQASHGCRSRFGQEDGSDGLGHDDKR